MRKETIKFVDYNGIEREEDYYFNLNKAEIMEMQLSTTGGLAEKIQEVVKAKDAKQIVAIFKELILKAYGKKSDDGKRFIKSKELSDEFAQTEAYSNLFMHLATDAEFASDFINGIVPQMEDSKKQLEEVVNK